MVVHRLLILGVIPLEAILLVEWVLLVYSLLMLGMLVWVLLGTPF
jgi:hypothetical protein